jgi:MarR family transcriptional regulator, organic hydroperoxide resistance regulator
MKQSKAINPQDHLTEIPHDAPLVGQFMHTWFRLGQAIKREIVPILEQFHGADFFDFMVLNCIKDGGIHPGGIAETLVVQPSQISRTLEGLVKRGLVERSLDAEDSRRVRLELTIEGHKVLKEVYLTVRNMLEPSFAQIGHDHIRNIMQSITHMTQAISSREHTPAVELERPAAIQTVQEVSR